MIMRNHRTYYYVEQHDTPQAIERIQQDGYDDSSEEVYQIIGLN